MKCTNMVSFLQTLNKTPKSRHRDHSTSNTCTRDITSVNKTPIFDLNDIMLMTG